MNFKIDAIQKRIREVMTKTPFKDTVKSLALFGSFAKNRERTDSDLDLLVVFEHPVGYFTLVHIQTELSRALNRKVDLVTQASLSKHFREEVLEEAILLYENR